MGWKQGLGHGRAVSSQENCPACAAGAPLACQSCCSIATEQGKETKVVPEVNKLYMTINLSNL